MEYYIIKNQVTSFLEALNEEQYRYTHLTPAQVAFYLSNPTVSVEEITSCTLAPTKPLDLESYKKTKIAQMSHLSLQTMFTEYPEYQLFNTILGVYDSVDMERKEKIKTYATLLRNEFYRLQTEIEKAKTVSEIDAIVATNIYSKYAKSL